MKNTTLQLRLNLEQKLMLERAAALNGTSVSSYLLSRTLNAAESEVSSHEKITLSRQDWVLFMSAIDQPPKPNAALKRAARQYKKKHR